MYKGLAVDSNTWVKGDKLEKKVNQRTWKEKAYIKTKEGKVEVYPNTVTKAVGVTSHGEYLYYGDIVRISNKKKSNEYSLESLQFSNSVFYQNGGYLYKPSDIENEFGRVFCVIKVGNRLEGGV